MKRASVLAIFTFLVSLVALWADKADKSGDGACHDPDETTLFQKDIKRVIEQIRDEASLAASFAGSGCGAAPSLDGAKVDELISNSKGVLIIGDPNKRCTLAAKYALNRHKEPFTMKNLNALPFSYSHGANPVWDWLHCSFPNDANMGTTMHSYVFRDGKFLGEGFRAAKNVGILTGRTLADGTSAAGAVKQIDALKKELVGGPSPVPPGGSSAGGKCAAFANEKKIVDGYMAIAKNKVLLFGWLGCPCTNLASSHFMKLKLCYDGRQWAEQNSRLLQYLQCKEGDSESHSFIYFRDSSGAWKFHGNGFYFSDDKRWVPYNVEPKTDAELNKLISDAGAATTCKHANIKINIFGEQLEECRTDAADMSGSWMDDGTCSEQTGGVHQICIEQLPADFSSETHQSAWSKQRKDKRHCVCIGAWSLYMTDAKKHPKNAAAIMPHCKAISETVLSRRYLSNWHQWNGYPANIVVGLKELVTRCLGQGNAKQKCELKKRFDKVVGEVTQLQGAVQLKGLNTTLKALSCS